MEKNHSFSTADDLIRAFEIMLPKEAQYKRRNENLSDWMYLEKTGSNNSDKSIIDKSSNLRRCRGSIGLFINEDNKLLQLPNERCGLSYLCPFCAIDRARRNALTCYLKIQEILKQNPLIRIYFMVLTVPNSDVLTEGFEFLQNSQKKLIKKIREAKSARKGKKQHNYALQSAFATILGGIYSIEIKRGKNSHKWHPHTNLLLVSSNRIDFPAVQKEWLGITGNASNIFCKHVQSNDLPKTVLEVMKYSLKFSNMEFDDQFEAYTKLRKKKLLGGFGLFRGLAFENEQKMISEYEFVKSYKFNGFDYN